jgi:uncharacterized protein YbjT (DUF2867 family)
MILITGSTGQIGNVLVRMLAESGERVRALVQPGERPTWSADLDVEEVTADFDDTAGLERAAHGADRVFMLVPPSPRQETWQRNIVAAARSAPADYVLKLSAFDTSPTSELTMGRWHYSGELALAQSGIPHAVLRPQYFIQNLLASPLIVTEAALPTFIKPSAPVGMIDAFDVAAVAASLLSAPNQPTDDTVLVPTGPRPVTVDQLAAELSRALSRTISVNYLEPEQGRAELRGRGMPDWRVEDVLYICRTASALVTDCVPRPTGRPGRDIADVVDDFAKSATRGKQHGD